MKNIGRVFLKGSFRVAYKKGHKNLKEIIAPARSVFAGTEGPVGKNRSGREGSCKKCGKCGMGTGVKREKISSLIVVWSYRKEHILGAASQEKDLG